MTRTSLHHHASRFGILDSLVLFWGALFWALLGVGAQAVLAEEPSVYVGAGVVSQYAGRLANQTSGTTSLTSAIFPELSVQGEFHFLGSLVFSPFVSYTPLGHQAPDEGSTSTLLNLALRVEKSFGSLNLRLGPSLLVYRISGTGGTIQLNNGTGTSTFGLPDDSSTSSTYGVDAGLGVTYDRFRLDADALISDPASSRRAVSLLVGLSYGLL